MADQITLEEALELVEFELCPEGWRVKNVKGNVYGDVGGDIWGDIYGAVGGDVWSNVGGAVQGNVGNAAQGTVWGTIKGRRWKFAKTPKEELKRLIEEGAGKDEILEALDQLDGHND